MAQEPQQLDLVFWTLSQGEVGLFVGIRRHLWLLEGLVDDLGTVCPELATEIRLLDRLLGNRGAACEVPPR